MDFIMEIESLKYSILEELYSFLPPSIFSPDSSLDKNVRYKLCGKFKKLERLIHSTNSQWWDKYFLNQYLKSRISPRDLCILKNCSFLEIDDAKEWGSLAEFCTTKWMTILVKHRDKKFEQLQKTVQALSTEIINVGQKISSPWLDILINNT